jgi:ribosomal protein S18 acetylase RimI-like enzyme
MNIIALAQDSTEWPEVTLMFKDMYSEMESDQLEPSLKEDGSSLWVNSQKKLAGKTSLVAVSKSDDRVQGFIHASISAQPQYLKKTSSGHIGHIYIKPEYRKINVAHELFEFSKNWFIAKKQDTIQLQVLWNNHKAIGFWETLNFDKTMTHYSIQI